MKKKLVLCSSVIAATLMMTGCSSNSADTGSNNKSATNTAAKASEKEPAKMLLEIRGYVVDLWNDGFVNISSYMNSGTSATGEKMDIDFTISQLDKAMKKKPDYDAYVNGLDESYDSIKQVWSKVSGEIDTMYKAVKDSPPQAEVRNPNFDTGLFSQYNEVFTEEVYELNGM